MTSCTTIRMKWIKIIWKPQRKPTTKTKIYRPIPPKGRDEVEMAINRLKSRKAPGVDNITAEEIEAATQGTSQTVIHRLCKRVWEEEELPSEWKRSVIVLNHKKKDKLDCSNYRWINPAVSQ